MQWSQLKEQIEERLATPLRGRVQFYNARYRHDHDQQGRGWITIDGEEVLDAATRSAWEAELHELDPQVQELRTGPTHLDAASWNSHVAELRRQAVERRQGRGLYTLPEFNEALRAYLQLSLEQVLESPLVLHRALAYLDRRLGKRRFRKLLTTPPVHPLEVRFRALRAEVEGWTLSDPSAPAA